MRTGFLFGVLLLGITTGSCLGMPPYGIAPSPATIARIESGRTLLRMMESVGVPSGDPAPMNSAARTRIRSRGFDRGTVHFLAEEADDDRDGWCSRSTTFVHGAPQRFLMEARIDGWTPEQP